MFPFDRSLDAWVGLGWLGASFVAAFAVTYVATDLLRMRRAPYVALLAFVTGGFTAAFLAWSGAGARFWSYQWGWGLLGAALASILMILVSRRLPRLSKPQHFLGLVAWEGVVYGAAEGVLLSVLPVAIMWQVLRSFGWTSTFEQVSAGVLAILASIVLVVVHHLGYWEFRSKLMKYPVIMCTGLGVAYLLTGNVIAPIVGHIVLHVVMLRRGVELPPHVRQWSAETIDTARAA
jgi:hypothetical protein